MRAYIAKIAIGTVLLAVPCGVAAKPGGGGLGAHSLSSHGLRLGHRAPFRRQIPWYGGVVANDLYPYYTTYGVGDDVIQKFILPPEPPRKLTCQRSQQIVTVPSDEGGTRQITITRC
jgi:hypothetical protein